MLNTMQFACIIGIIDFVLSIMFERWLKCPFIFLSLLRGEMFVKTDN